MKIGAVRNLLMTGIAAVLATSATCQTTDPDEIQRNILYGRVEPTINMLVADLPTVMFAWGALDAGRIYCDIPIAPDVIEGLTFNLIHVLRQQHLGFVDAMGRPDKTNDLWELQSRVAAFTLLMADYKSRYFAMGADAVDAYGEFLCQDDELSDFLQNAQAILAMDKLPHVMAPTATTLVKEARYEGVAEFECHYILSKDDIYTVVQVYRAPGTLDPQMIQFGASETYLNNWKEPPLIRASCPGNPDPYRLRQNGAPVQQYDASQSRAVQLARFYETYIRGRRGFSSDAARTRLLDEIIAFEDIEVSAPEVTRTAHTMSGRYDRMESACYFADEEVRRTKFHAAFGRATGLDLQPHPLQEQGYTNLFDGGGGYLGFVGFGRGAALTHFGLAWTWDGTQCRQGPG